MNTFDWQVPSEQQIQEEFIIEGQIFLSVKLVWQIKVVFIFLMRRRIPLEEFIRNMNRIVVLFFIL